MRRSLSYFHTVAQRFVDNYNASAAGDPVSLRMITPSAAVVSMGDLSVLVSDAPGWVHATLVLMSGDDVVDTLDTYHTDRAACAFGWAGTIFAGE